MTTSAETRPAKTEPQNRLKERKEQDKADLWNVEALYPTLSQWEDDLKRWGREGQSPHWPEISAFKGKISQGAKQLKALLEVVFQFDRQLSKLFTYAHLRHDEDVANDAHKNAFSRISSLLYDFRQETAWMEPEILQLSESFLDADELKDYRVHLEKIIRLKPHTLSADKEELLALSGKALESSQRAFGAFNNADLKFPDVEDSQGQHLNLSHGKYLLYMRSKDRKLRQNAFSALHQSFRVYENTLAELINGQVQKHLFDTKARQYSSCLDAALFPNQIDLSVYHSLIRSVRERLPSLHRYLALRKKILKYDELHMYDLHVPLVAQVEFSFPYQQGEKLVVDSVAILGKEYQTQLEKGLMHDRWVDRYENQRKRSGAYSSGCYDSMPYILMNYQGTLNDVMTLSHEAGHSMHTFLSSKHQPYHYSSYPIFVAEVASTFHEELLMRHLLTQVKSKEEKGFLINQKIEDIRNTLFRQTMFAEFELKLHEWAQQGVPLTPTLLKEEYQKLNRDYFGPDVVIDREIEIEWARIPHFYYNFYVYQYATGISAALALVDKVVKEGEKARDKYLQFLSSGSSRYPLDLLAMAGVDMRKGEAVASAIDKFDQLVTDFSQLF